MHFSKRQGIRQVNDALAADVRSTCNSSVKPLGLNFLAFIDEASGACSYSENVLSFHGVCI